MYGLEIEEACENIYENPELEEALKIKTHYESLDIAQSKKIFYLRFKLPESIPFKDKELHQFLKQTEPSLSS